MRKPDQNSVVAVLSVVLGVLWFLSSGCAGQASMSMRGVWVKASFPLKVAAFGAACYPASDAAHYWNNSIGMTLFEVSCVNDEESAAGSDVVAIPQMLINCAGHDYALGCTQRVISSRHNVHRATVYVDHDKLNQFDPWAEPTADFIDRTDQVYRHEFGHVLGFDHTVGTVMDEWRDIRSASDEQIGLFRYVYGER